MLGSATKGKYTDGRTNGEALQGHAMGFDHGNLIRWAGQTNSQICVATQILQLVQNLCDPLPDIPTQPVIPLS